MAFLFKSKLQRKQDKEKKISYKHFPDLAKIKAHERYIFHSDYFQIDDYYATIMMFRHQLGAMDNFGPFWGVNLIPHDLPDGVTTVNFDQVQRMGEGWIESHQNNAEKISGKNIEAQAQNGTLTSKQKAKTTSRDLAEIAQELNSGAAYLNVHDRLLVKAPDLATLDRAVEKIEREYTDNFGTLKPAIYNGRQKQEFYNLLGWNKAKYGDGFYYTSVQYSGALNLVTHGLEDPGGDYVGFMTGDVNNSAVLFDGDSFRRSAVIASSQINDDTGKRLRVPDMWGSKLSQTALLNNHRVVHLVLSPGTNLDDLGPKFNDITAKIDMSKGDVNMFEVFGKKQDELKLFSQQMNKLVLMTEQAYKPTEEDKSIIENALRDAATNFYIKQRMWRPDAQNNRDKLRLVGIPHDSVPTLQVFVTYLSMYYKKALNASVPDPDQTHAYNVLQGVYNTLLTNEGDLFNTHTTNRIDDVVNGRRVIYDFSGLMSRDPGVAMAQLVNILAYAASTLNDKDVLIIHGAERIDKGIRDYCNRVFDELYSRGGRIIFLYDDVDEFLQDRSFNKYDSCDYTIIGNMTQKQVDAYEEGLGATVPQALSKLIMTRNTPLNYIRRGTSNVVFVLQLPLIPNLHDYGIRQRRHYK